MKRFFLALFVIVWASCAHTVSQTAPLISPDSFEKKECFSFREGEGGEIRVTLHPEEGIKKGCRVIIAPLSFDDSSYCGSALPLLREGQKVWRVNFFVPAGKYLIFVVDEDERERFSYEEEILNGEVHHLGFPNL